jgi:hypothetical protein
MLVAATTVAALLIANPSATDADRIAANGGFLLGNAHRCGVDTDRVVRVGQLVRELIIAASDNDTAGEAAITRFSQFFLVSALGDPKEEAVVASCRMVSNELGRLERHQFARAKTGKTVVRPFGPGDGE